MKKFKASFPYFLEYPIKVVAEKISPLGFFTWLFQKSWNKYIRDRVKPEDLIISERIVELPSIYYLLGTHNLKPGSKILEIGHVNSSLSLELANLGYSVTAIDLRKYSFQHNNLKSIEGDFLTHDFEDKFDCIITISTIEHFGFNKRYGGEENEDKGLDKKAFAKISNLLDEGGRFILTVPYAKQERQDTWFKTYTRGSIHDLLVPYFAIKSAEYFVRDKNSWDNIAKNKSRDPVLPYDGVAIFSLTRKLS